MTAEIIRLSDRRPRNFFFSLSGPELEGFITDREGNATHVEPIVCTSHALVKVVQAYYHGVMERWEADTLLEEIKARGLPEFLPDRCRPKVWQMANRNRHDPP